MKDNFTLFTPSFSGPHALFGCSTRSGLEKEILRLCIACLVSSSYNTPVTACKCTDTLWFAACDSYVWRVMAPLLPQPSESFRHRKTKGTPQVTWRCMWIEGNPFGFSLMLDVCVMSHVMAPTQGGTQVEHHQKEANAGVALTSTGQ